MSKAKDYLKGQLADAEAQQTSGTLTPNQENVRATRESDVTRKLAAAEDAEDQ